MHPEVELFVKRAYDQISYAHFPFSVVEFGSRNVNGSVRDIFKGCDYIGVDTLDGLDVDIICDAAEYTPEKPVDIVVCCETLEHTNRAHLIVANAYKILKPEGAFIMTAAMPPRLHHSMKDGTPFLEQLEYYSNIEPAALLGWSAAFKKIFLECHVDRGDIYALAFK